MFAPLRPLCFVVAALCLYAGLAGEPRIADGQLPIRMTCSQAQSPSSLSQWVIFQPSALDFDRQVQVPDHGTFVPIITADPCPVLAWYPDGTDVPPKGSVRYAIGYLFRFSPQIDNSMLSVVNLYFSNQYRSGATVLQIGRRSPYLWQPFAFGLGVVLVLLFLPWGRMRLFRDRQPNGWNL